MQNLLHEIDDLKMQLSKKRPLTLGELQRLRDEFMIDFTYNSNAIEGNTLTLQETSMVLEGITIDKKPLKEHLEVVGHRDAFIYVESLVKEKTIFSERVIKEIHTLVLMDRPQDRGIYRRIPVRIMGATNVPLEPHLVSQAMEKLIQEFGNNSLHLIEEVSLFHLKFEGIHPFIDGNGRTGRLIMNLMLMQGGYLPINVKFADRREYYNAFEAYYKDGSSTQMISLVAGYVKEELEKILSFL